MNFLLTIIACGTVFAAATVSVFAQEPSTTTPLMHTRTEFHFTAEASFEEVAPLFGANEERKWAPDWNPQFVYPLPARDQQGMVFKVEHGQFSSTWVNTAFDLAAGHVQYAYVLNDAMATLIDIHLTRESATKTAVAVIYERTALIPEANEHVQHFAKGDEKSGKEWGDSINVYFANLRAGKK
jgi:hypothetical protein